MKDLYNRIRSTKTILPIALTSSNANGTGVDLLNYQGALMEVHVGASGGTLGGSNYITIGFFSSTDNSTFTAIADTDLIGGNNTHVINANANANCTVQRGYVGTARYVNVQIAPTGTVALPVSAAVVKGFVRDTDSLS